MAEAEPTPSAPAGKSKKKNSPMKVAGITVLSAGGVYALYYLYQKYKADQAATAATTAATAPADSTTGTPGGGGTGTTGTTGTTGDTTASGATYGQTDFIQSAVAAMIAANPKISAEEANNVVNDILNGEPVPAGDAGAATAFADWLNSGGYSDASLAGLTVGNITVARSTGHTGTSGTGGTGTGSGGGTAGGDAELAAVKTVVSGTSSGDVTTTGTNGSSKTANAASKAVTKVKAVAKKAGVKIAPQDTSATKLETAVTTEEFNAAGPKLRTKITSLENSSAKSGKPLFPVPGVNAGADAKPRGGAQTKSAAKVVNPLNTAAIKGEKATVSPLDTAAKPAAKLPAPKPVVKPVPVVKKK